MIKCLKVYLWVPIIIMYHIPFPLNNNKYIHCLSRSSGKTALELHYFLTEDYTWHHIYWFMFISYCSSFLLPLYFYIHTLYHVLSFLYFQWSCDITRVTIVTLTLPRSCQTCSQMCGHMGDNISVWLSINLNTKSWCIPSTSISLYLSRAAWYS